jgi:uncharacterized protein (DUF305 family)
MTAGRWTLLALLGAIVTTACGSTRTPSGSPPSAGVSAAEFERIYRARTDSARLRYTAADVRFMTHMIEHHAQALVMAALVPDRSTSAAIRTLAARITNGQRDEIATMQRWLRDRGQPVPELHGAGPAPMVHGAGHAATMPGMLTPEQLRELEQARGTAFDRRFLESMIRHHRGAVIMVEELFATDGSGQDEEAFRFAADAQVDQQTEIARMERMLAELAAAGA